MRISDWSSDVCPSDLQIETACIIQHILVRRALGTAIGGMEIERAAPVDAIGAQMLGSWQISAVDQREVEILQPAIDLVGGGVDHGRRRGAAEIGRAHV